MSLEPQSHSASPAPGSTVRHAITALDRQRSQLERLLKDPSKPAYIPPPPKEKIVRAAREMMKNVQGSSAGAGSGEFHVYKASRRREYERLKIMEESARKEAETAVFEKRRQETADQAEAKTAKNRAKRQKRKERAKVKPADKANVSDAGAGEGIPLKKRRIVNGTELVFRKPEDVESGEEATGPDQPVDEEPASTGLRREELVEAPPLILEQKIIIHEDD
ncbi:hypothetical protein J3A83DRAFT_2654082 [Scleroderma citrinum]